MGVVKLAYSPTNNFTFPITINHTENYVLRAVHMEFRKYNAVEQLGWK